MPFGLRNAGAMYQRLVDKAFHRQIGRNLEVYVDDLVIKSRIEDEIVRDIEETFKTLKEINMKLNPKKQGRRCLESSIPKMLERSTKVKQKACKHEQVLSQISREIFTQLIAELPMLTAPMEQEELIDYLAIAKEMPIQRVLSRPKVAGRLQKLSIELGEYAIHYKPRVSVKGKILSDFIVERPKEESLDTLMEVDEEFPEPWILFMDRSSCTNGYGAGLILINPEAT
ncbi:reverse transcriptase domain-containing protein [Tanacetum coccineum]